MRNGTQHEDDETVKFTLYLPFEAKERLLKWAKRHHRSASAQILHIVDQEEPPNNTGNKQVKHG